MIPPTGTTPPSLSLEERRDVLYGAGRDLGHCVLGFPTSTFFGAMLIGFWGYLHQISQAGDLPLWIALSFFVLLSGLAVYSARSARRGFTKAGMPPREVRRQLAGMWIAAAILMIVEGGCVLGGLSLTYDPARGGASLLFPVERPVPLAMTFSLYVVAAAVLLGRSWRERRDAGGDRELPASGIPVAAADAEWPRVNALHMAGRNAEGVILVVVATAALAFLIGLARFHPGSSEVLPWVVVGILVLLSVCGVLIVQRSRRHLEAAGFSPEEVSAEVASTWRVGGFIMTVAGLGGLGFVALGADLLDAAELRWAAGSGLVYTLVGVFLLWRFRKRR